ncbi:MAG: OmpA family protein [Syntrophorhabdus aromaticivorans]|uniref:OmpA family protein n=1 Tax=Syntrophorhabdus aromaticivorans TaxID=328301 RepID=A0A971M5X0_9BACT|nr:OmpA family protein [Syntrophorhabdus aromaticivorans]
MSQDKSNTMFSNSFVDLMTSLAVIFILLLCASLNNAQGERQTTRNSVLVEMKNALKEFTAGGIEVKTDPKDPLGLLVLVPEDLLAFRLDRADISAAGDVFLRSFIPKLSAVVCSPRFSKEVNSIIVEGHTDSTGTDRHNWDLSQKRSMSVVRASLNILDDRGMREEKAAFLQLLSATGRGSAEIVRDTAGVENPSMSRRVIFKLRFRSVEQMPVLETLGTARG